MNVLFVNSYYSPDEVGGAERSVRFLAEAIAKKGHQATVFCTGRSEQRVHLNGVLVERCVTPNIYQPLDGGQHSPLKRMVWHAIDSYNPAAGKKLARILDVVKPDLVHTNTVAGLSVAVWAEAKKRNIPVVHTLRDYYLMCPNTAMFKNGRPCNGRCMSCCTLSAGRRKESLLVDFVVGNSKFILDQHLENGYFSDSIKGVIYNAYEPKENSLVRSNNLITLGYIGRLAPTKGVDKLICALKDIPSHLKFRLIVAGDGDLAYVSKLKDLAKGLNVEFLGLMKPEDFYSQVDWTVVPSLWDEPLARVIFESFAHGVPVIGSATGGTPELIVTGQNGILYAIDEANVRLKEALVSAIKDVGLALSMRNRCLEDAEQFKPNIVLDKYLGVYEQAISHANAQKARK